MKTWRIWAESEPVPAGEWSERVDVLLEELSRTSASGPVGWGTGNSLGTVFEIEAEDAEAALTNGAAAFSQSLRNATKGLEPVGIRRMEVASADFEPLDMLGASDVARVLNVSRQRVYQLLSSFDNFPRPAAKLARGAVWSRHEVEAWRDSRHHVPFLVEFLLDVKVAPPRVRQPSDEKRQRFVREIAAMANHCGVDSEARWTSPIEAWIRFCIDASSEADAKDSASRVVRSKAQDGAKLAIEDDLGVRFIKVEPVASS